MGASMTTLTPQDFVAKWKRAEARERQSVQEHFLDLCSLVGHPTPIEFDPTGKEFAFEMGAAKVTGGQGWADVAKLEYFAWEYKGKHADLDKAYVQILRYRDSLQNPPLLIVSDIDSIIIRTNYTNYKTLRYVLTLDDILTSRGMQILKAVFFNPDELKPRESLQAVTENAAKEFNELANNLEKYGEDPQGSAHFLIRILFCLFAQDIGLLPQNLLSRLIEQTRNNSRDLAEAMRELFAKMSKGGFYGADRIPYIDGGLFNDDTALQLDSSDVKILQRIDKMDWASIEPSIFGTLFERGLNPTKRSQLGQHYTSKADIMLIVEPVLMAPLRDKWAAIKQAVQSLADERDVIRKSESKQINETIHHVLEDFSKEISSISVLDPACGSANFLYVALRLLLDLQKEVNIFCEHLGAGRLPITVSPTQLHGIEIDTYAHELAQLTIWIGYIQWLVDNDYGLPNEPVLQPIESIIGTDAILAYDENGKPKEPDWAPADIIIGNPPFLGNRKMRPELGNKYCDALLEVYGDRMEGMPDLVCYWFEKANNQVKSGKTKRVGLLATQAIRGGTNRQVLDDIKESGNIFFAYSDKEWILDGATVHVSMVGFDDGSEQKKELNGHAAENINSDLTGDIDLSEGAVLHENENLSFQGVVLRGKFNISHAEAEKMLKRGGNPNGRPNSDVIRRRRTGEDVVGLPSDSYVIDFGVAMSLEEAAQYSAPFEYLKKNVYPSRQKANQTIAREKWWIHWNPRTQMRTALSKLKRYIATPRVAKHRIFVWLEADILPDAQLVVFARDDDYFFGVLHSKIHELWARRLGTQLRDAVSGFRYTSTTTFETFPFPWSPGKEPKDHPHVSLIAQAAKELVEQRDRWLKAEDLSEAEKKSRTLTSLYNVRPTWLDLAHNKLDNAVLTAYGLDHDANHEIIFRKLLALNLERSKKG